MNLLRLFSIGTLKNIYKKRLKRRLEIEESKG